MSDSMKVEMWPTDKPVAYASNARMLSPNAVDKVAASIKEFGFKQPIVVTEDGVIIVGHTRLLAAKKLGLAEVPVLVATDLTPQQARAFRLTDNRTSEETSWDFELLAIELNELQSFDFDVSITGFDSDEIEGMALGEPDIREYTGDDLEVGDEVEEAEVEVETCPKCGYSFPREC